MESDRWELYDLRSDFSQANDLAAREPARLEELKALFMREAAANDVLPLRGQRYGSVGLPDPSGGATSATYHEGTIGVPEKAVPRMLNRSWSLAADVDVGAATRGVVATIGGRSAGWSLYLDADRRPVFVYRAFEAKTVRLAGAPLAPGAHALRVDFDYAGGGYGKGAALRLLADDQPVATDSIPASPVAFFSIDETFDVGVDTGSPAGFYPPDAAIGYRYADGRIARVTIALR